LGIAGVGVLALGLYLSVKFISIPPPNSLAEAQTAIFYYDDGKTEIGRIGTTNRISVELKRVPLITQHAVLAAEDRQYYQHGGVSYRGIARALLNNLKGSAQQGGSTITQQYAKNAYLTQSRTITRKLKELVLSIKLESAVSKDKILEDYLNTIYFGRGAYGIETAANQYFGEDTYQLNVAQSAVLAAIIQAPNGLAPESNLAGLQSRWNYVLDGMVSQGWLAQADRDSLKFPHIRAYSLPNSFAGPRGFLLEQARQALYKQGITEDELNRAGYRVTTTFNRQAQASAVAAVHSQGPSYGNTGLRIGLASVRPGTGEVVAIYGGADYLKDQLNNATQALGQGGSTFKPFTLASAFENGYTLNSTFSGRNGTYVGNYRVVNYGGESWRGNISLLTATENSVNSAFVQCADRVGTEKVLDAVKRAGMPETTAGLNAGLTLTLGTASPHVVDEAGAYATFAAHGVQANVAYIKKVTDLSGRTVFEFKPKTTQAFSAPVADTVSYALQKVVQVGTGFAARALGRPAAGKTGTTNDNMSAWFSGFTPDLATSVMLVKDSNNGNPISLAGTGGMSKVTGGSFPARIWTAYMKGALAGKPVTQFPPLPQGPLSTLAPGESPSANVWVTSVPSASVTSSALPSDSPTAMPTRSSTPTAKPIDRNHALLPDVTNSTAGGVLDTNASELLTALGFNPVLSPVDGTDPLLPMYVIGQSPAGNTVVPKGTTVLLTTSNIAP
jgi:membrane peptidoglycan carboxypeptidase